jgi:hypothetical protein
MRQLQQTVERLAVRVSVASTDIETEKCCLLQVCRLPNVHIIMSQVYCFVATSKLSISLRDSAQLINSISSCKRSIKK